MRYWQRDSEMKSNFCLNPELITTDEYCCCECEGLKSFKKNYPTTEEIFDHLMEISKDMYLTNPDPLRVPSMLEFVMFIDEG